MQTKKDFYLQVFADAIAAINQKEVSGWNIQLSKNEVMRIFINQKSNWDFEILKINEII